jgi:hypothetical protein
MQGTIIKVHPQISGQGTGRSPPLTLATINHDPGNGWISKIN